MRIPRPVIDRIYAAIDILEVVQDYVPLKKRGQNWWGLSPFKAERTPSFAVNPNKGIFKDFSSGKGGNAVTFLMELEGFSYTEALLHLAKKYQIEVPEITGEDRSAEDKRTSLFALNKFAAEWYQRQLSTEEGKTVGLTYFTERGISQPAREAYGLGYSPEQWDALTQTALKLNFAPELLVEVGLTLRSEDGARLYDRFRGRVIFPIHDAAGRVAGFAGRLLKSDAKAAKYVNSPESLIYAKSHLLYGLFQARQAIREAGECLLTEGYTDVISLHQAGVKHVVASSGTSLTEGQIALIARYAKRITLLYDGDTAGVNAALRAMDLILEAGLAVKAVVLPDNHDPDSFVRQYGAEAFARAVSERSQDVVGFKLGAMGLPDAAAAQAAGPDTVARALNELGTTLSRIPDEITRSLYATHAARQLGVAEQLALSAVNQALIARARAQQQAAGRQAAAPPDGGAQSGPPAPAHPHGPLIAPGPNDGLLETYHQERELLRLLLNYGDTPIATETGEASVLQVLEDELAEAVFDHPLHEKVRHWLFDRHSRGEAFTMQPLLAEEGPEVGRLVSDLLTLQIELSENWHKLEVTVPPLDADLPLAVSGAVDHWLWRRVHRLLDQNRVELKHATELTAIDQLLQRQQRLEALRREIAERLGIVVKG